MKATKTLFIALFFSLLFLCIPSVKADSLISNIAAGTKPVAIAVNQTTNKIYVANQTSGNVSVINGATNAWIKNITVGTGPRAIAVNSVTNRIFVANTSSNNVSVIDGSTDTLISNIATGNNPLSLDINTATNKVYVANSGLSKNVTIIDGATLTTTNVGVGTYPTDIIVNQAANKIYVVNNGDSTVSVINGATGTVSKTISAAGFYIAFNSATNKFYLSTTSNGNISVINGATDTLSSTIAVTGGFGMYKPSVNITTNKIYLADPFANSVFILDGATDALSTQISLGAGNSPRYVSYNPITNKIYVTNSATNLLKVYDGSSNNLVSSLTTGAYPMAIGINQATSKIYVLNQNGSNVSIFDGSIPTITTLTPNSGIVGSSVTISGTGFGSVQGTSTVKFNGITATVTSWSATSIVVTVPTGATTGNVIVTTSAGTSNGISFTVTVPSSPLQNLQGGAYYMVGDKNQGKIYALMALDTFKFAIIDHATGSVSYKNVSGFAPKETAALHFSINPTTSKIYLPYSKPNSSMKNNLAIIDENTFKTIKDFKNLASIDIKKIVVDETGNRIFVLDGSGTITVISGSTNKTVTELSVSTGYSYVATDIEYDPIRNKIYTIGYNNSAKTKSMTVVNGATYKILKSMVFTGKLNPGGQIFLDSTNAKVYVNFPVSAYPSSGLVFAIDGISDTITKTITLPDFFVGLSIDSAHGKVYILTSYKIIVINAGTLADITTITSTDRNFLITANQQTGKIYVFQDSVSAPIHDGTGYQVKVYDGTSYSLIDTKTFPYPVAAGTSCNKLAIEFNNKYYIIGTVAWQYAKVSSAPAYLMIAN
ncbi:MAG TPA: IPT/TIG domain-containing protein [Patescibacteria group bacterium]|nr:IPT/TIG domain-containing protein [Patescibacteria group bacterium]